MKQNSSEKYWSARGIKKRNMKHIKKKVFGGIRSKVFILILFTVALLAVAFMGISLYQSHMLSKMVSESGEAQQAAVSEIAGEGMEQVVTQSLKQSNIAQARFVDKMFKEAGDRVTFLADYAEKLVASPNDYEPQPYSGPDPNDDGKWTAKVIFADGTDETDPEIAERVGLMANLFDVMISLCPSFGAETIYIGMPEGVHLSVSDESSSWFRDGELISYDPRGRGWYQKAVKSGGLIFTDGEWDATTGEYCVECARPVYEPGGTVCAVVGSDLFLNEMQEVMQDSPMEGEYNLLVNQSGCAVLPMQAEVFPMAPEDRDADLRTSSNEVLATVVTEALQGIDNGVTSGSLEDGSYYVTATLIPTTGWVLVSAFSQAVSDRPSDLLRERLSTVQDEVSQEYQSGLRKMRIWATVLFGVVLLLTLGAALVLGGHIVKPLNTITRRISQLDEGNLEFKMEDAYRTGDEVEKLAESFAAISHKTVEYMDRIVKVTAEKERLGTELALATQIQASMLPHIFPAFPERSEFDIFASMNPAKEVGGDFYDYFLIDDDHLGLVIADVSGKGVPAALFMMASKIILQSVAMLGYSPAQVLSRTNDAVCSNNETQMFVTVWMGILELSTGKLAAASAGHEYPVLKMPGSAFELYKDRHGFVVGGMEGIRYKEYEILMEPGSRLFVYTDGVPEATNADNELFGTERMVEALNIQPDAAPEDVLKHVRQAVDDFVKDAEQFDDLTMLCIEYKGKQIQDRKLSE